VRQKQRELWKPSETTAQTAIFSKYARENSSFKNQLESVYILIELRNFKNNNIMKASFKENFY
jgi:hypothetical protein